MSLEMGEISIGYNVYWSYYGVTGFVEWIKYK